MKVRCAVFTQLSDVLYKKLCTFSFAYQTKFNLSFNCNNVHAAYFKNSKLSEQ